MTILKIAGALLFGLGFWACIDLVQSAPPHHGFDLFDQRSLAALGAWMCCYSFHFIARNWIEG